MPRSVALSRRVPRSTAVCRGVPRCAALCCDLPLSFFSFASSRGDQGSGSTPSSVTAPFVLRVTAFGGGLCYVLQLLAGAVLCVTAFGGGLCYVLQPP